MSVQGAELRGQCWSMLASDTGQAPVLPTLSSAGSMVRISPVPAPSDDVMKLPREDMSMFGRCPAWDNFLLVTCDKCDQIVKIEALESHVTLRHGSKSERSAYHRVLAAKAAASLNSCQVKLTPCSTATHSTTSTPTLGSSREGELPSSSCTSPQPPLSPEPMDTDQPNTGQPGKFVSESEADSTTNNVISIQDTDDMANIEIISEGQSLLDSMDSKFIFSGTSGAQQSVDSTSYTSLSSSVPNTSKPLNAPSSLSRSSSTVESMEVDSIPSPGAQPPTHYISVSPLSKPNANKKMMVGRMVQPHNIPHPAQPGSEKKSSRDREYDPNKHCGVADPESKKPCTRSLTCKSHSVYLKRKVVNRSSDFDELLANHRAEKEAAAAKQSESAEPAAGCSILERRLKLTPGQGGTTRILGQIQVVSQQQHSPSGSWPKDLFSDDTLHYTTDHPKPLAVCTFGGKRLGGLFIGDRSRLLTRKVMKVALNNSGIRSVPIVRQQTMPYIVNFQSGASTMPGIPARIGTIKLATSPGILQPQQIITVQEPFKSDIQDTFKGGLKFELSRNLHTIIPSGSDAGTG